MKTIAHAVAGALALALVTTFLFATLTSELLLGQAAVVAVKTGILYGVLLLIPLMAITGGSGFSLAKGRTGPLIDKKKTRMKLLAANGALVMLPAAIFLFFKSTSGSFDPVFYTVQMIEILGGLAQLTLLGLNFRAGLKMTARKRAATRRLA